MTPTVFSAGGFRFFSRQENGFISTCLAKTGEAKFWLEPQIELAQNFRLSDQELNLVRKLIEEHEDEIRDAWQRHFGS